MNTTKEELVQKLYYGTYDSHRISDLITEYANQQVLTALEEVKSKRELLFDEYKDAPFNAVPLSAIEQIEEKYK